MKSLPFRLGFVALCSLCLGTGAFAQNAKLEFPAASPNGTVNQRVGLTDIRIEYSRPSVKGRKIFGGLLRYGEVWRTGANTATKVRFSTDVKLNGTVIPEGTYELFTIPNPDTWTVIIHKNMSQWGAYDYDPKNDVARIPAKPVALPAPVESLEIGFNDLRDESATLTIAWEKVRVPLKLTVDVKSTLVPQIEAAMAAGGDKLPYASAAMYYFENGLDLKKAAAWMDAGIAANPEAFYLNYRKGLILEKMGDKPGALAAAQKTLAAANQQTGALRDEYVRLSEALIARVK